MKIYPVCMLIFLLAACNVQAITINEIMPDPDDNCGDCSEWMEITTHFDLSLENITVDTGDRKNITLNGSMEAGEFMVITQNATMFKRIWNPNATVFENSDMSLRNKGDNITIYNNSEILQKVGYTGSENNRSYGLCNSTFILQNISTPGLPNICSSEEINETNETNQTNGSETNITNATCDLSLSLESDLIFVSGEKQNYYLVVEDENCDQEEKEVSIEYWIEDLFGEKVKSEYTTTKSMTCSKNTSRQWTPKGIEGSEAFYIIANITNSTCNDSDHSNDLAKKIVIVKGEKTGPDECPPCETKETVCSCGPCPKCPAEDEEEKEEDFEIISYPEEAVKDEEIEIKIEIRNNQSQPRNYSVYSYVYEGNKILSTGFDGNSWLNTWDANRQNTSVPGNSSAVLELRNRIAQDTNPGKYNLRVRIWLDGNRHDMTREILIKELTIEPKNQTAEEKNETSDISEPDNETSGTRMTTGRIISKREENWFSDFIKNVINFFKNLFNIK